LRREDRSRVDLRRWWNLSLLAAGEVILRRKLCTPCSLPAAAEWRHLAVNLAPLRGNLERTEGGELAKPVSAPCSLCGKLPASFVDPPGLADLYGGTSLPLSEGVVLLCGDCASSPRPVLCELCLSGPAVWLLTVTDDRPLGERAGWVWSVCRECNYPWALSLSDRPWCQNCGARSG